jgi:hypothetical protein
VTLLGVIVEHPVWSLIFLCVILGTVEEVARHIFGGRKP